MTLVLKTERGQTSPCVNNVNGWAFGYTVDRPGQWTLVLRPLSIFQLPPSPNCTMNIHLGGGGNDCVSGRDPAQVPPNVTDAPNQSSTLPLLGQEISCTGSLTALDFDFSDQYVFPVLANEPVAVRVLPALPGSIGAVSGMIAGV